MLRFELEKALIEGSLAVKDLPQAWDEAMYEYLGIKPDCDKNGCLQDVHWPSGLFGYFPAYALGNLIGAQTYVAMGKDLGDLDEVLRRGGLLVIHEWLREHIYVHGQRYFPDELLLKVTGENLKAQPFVDYLEKKYTALYRL